MGEFSFTALSTARISVILIRGTIIQSGIIKRGQSNAGHAVKKYTIGRIRTWYHQHSTTGIINGAAEVPILHSYLSLCELKVNGYSLRGNNSNIFLLPPFSIWKSSERKPHARTHTH